VNTDAVHWVREKSAALFGVRPHAHGMSCAVCGHSPYGPSKRPIESILSKSFSDHDSLISPTSQQICEGCDTLLGGRPGRTPPPFRMVHALVLDHEVQILQKPSDIVEHLLSPPTSAFGLVWATSKKKHAWLHAERCTAERIIVGSDHGPVEYIPGRDETLVHSVSALLARHGREVIRRGDYPSTTHAWAEHEKVVAQYRPGLLLDMLCAIVPRTEEPEPDLGREEMLDQNDSDAVYLLTALASGSSIRVNDGLMFWKGMFRHRVQRFSRLSLPAFVSRMMDELAVQPSSVQTGHICLAMNEWPVERQEAASRAIRERGALLVALAFDEIQNQKRRRV
jgi:hypothetical protein